MYADRLEGEAKPSIRDRLAGTAVGNSIRRALSGKRQRQDDKWEHDFFGDNRPQLSRKLGRGDLRLKLQQKSSQQDFQSGVQDLREKLSSSFPLKQAKRDAPKPKPEPEVVKPARRSVIAQTPVAEAKNILNSTSRKKTTQKVDVSVDGFLHSLGLEKYLITFQAEEVDMTALKHMSDEDLKAIGIPMGPRKKILSSLN